MAGKEWKNPYKCQDLNEEKRKTIKKDSCLFIQQNHTKNQTVLSAKRLY